MREDVISLFHEVADLPFSDRLDYYSSHQIPREIQDDVESLLKFDTQTVSLSNQIAETAQEVLQASNGVTEGKTFGRYRVIRLLGQGGMGAVYLAERTDGEVEQQVAIKVVHSGTNLGLFEGRFLRERRILASLNHPGVARLFDAGHTGDGRPYLVMEYVNGVSIDEYCAPLGLREVLKLFLAVCDAVAYAHRNLIIHRDLKPSNILIDASGRPKLLDFGIARIIDNTDEARTQVRILTPEFASPEQIRGEAYNTATDIYSLAAVLRKLATKVEIPTDIEFILRKAMRIEPEERYVTVDAFAEDIQAFLDNRPVQARSGAGWYRARKFLRRYWMPVSAAAVVTLSLAAGLYIAERQRAVAEARVTQLRQLSRQLLDFEKQLSLPNAGSDMRFHRKFVATSIQYLESLRPDGLRDKQLALEIGDGYLRIARIQGVPEWNQLGQYAEAEKNLSKAAEIAETVLAADPNNREALWQVANVAHDRAVIAYAERRPAEVIAWSPKAVEGFDRLARLGNLTRRDINGATYIYGDLAEVQTGLHRFWDAVRYARLGIDYSRNTSTVPGPRAQAFNMLAAALTGLGDLQGAQEAVRQARQLWELLLRKEGDTHYTRLILYQTRCREGLLLGEDGGVNLNRPQEAAVRLREAFDALENFTQTDRNNYEARTTIAMGGHYLGDLLRRTSPQRALEVYDHSLLRVREVPDDVAARRLEVLLLAGSSYAARGMHRERDAMARIEAAFRLLRETGDYPAAVLTPGSEADIAVRALADHDAETGRLDEAIWRYQELRRSLLASNPDARSDLLNAVSLTALDASLAALLRRAGGADQAAALEAANQEIWRHWDRQLPKNPFVLRELAAAESPSRPFILPHIPPPQKKPPQPHSSG